MDKQIKLSEWIQRFKSGEFNKPDTTTQIKAGWFDWFCRDSSLANKTVKMGNIIKQIKAGGKVDLKQVMCGSRTTAHSMVHSTMILESQTSKTTITYSLFKSIAHGTISNTQFLKDLMDLKNQCFKRNHLENL
jgi:hypothetical protein